jgi:hypothetical protein
MWEKQDHIISLWNKVSINVVIFPKTLKLLILGHFYEVFFLQLPAKLYIIIHNNCIHNKYAVHYFITIFQAKLVEEGAFVSTLLMKQLLQFSKLSGDHSFILLTSNCGHVLLVWQAQWEELLYMLNLIPCGDDGATLEYQAEIRSDRQPSLSLARRPAKLTNI